MPYTCDVSFSGPGITSSCSSFQWGQSPQEAGTSISETGFSTSNLTLPPLAGTWQRYTAYPRQHWSALWGGVIHCGFRVQISSSSAGITHREKRNTLMWYRTASCVCVCVFWHWPARLLSSLPSLCWSNAVRTEYPEMQGTLRCRGDMSVYHLLCKSVLGEFPDETQALL